MGRPSHETADARDPGCPSVEAIMAYVEGALEPEARDEVDAHVDDCPACAALVAHAAREAGVVASDGEETPPQASGAWAARPLPSRVGRYVILERVGRGGMGIVCSAYDPRLRRNVAVKLLRPDRRDPDAGARLRREARALATLSHPNVVSVFECGALADRDGDYLVMELVEGETLRRWCERTRRPTSEIVAVYLAAARGLAAAHAAGLVHRDFKPDNVLVGPGPRGDGAPGRVCVTDFGLARALVGPTNSERSAASSHGSASDFAGTPMYMAPEQHDGGPVGPAADQYAFCVSLWEATTGARPPAGDTSVLSTRLRAVLMRGLSLEPAARWPDMDALARAIASARRSSVARVAAVVAGLALVGGIAMVALDETRPPDASCALSTRRVDETWSPDRRAAVAELGRAAGAPEVVAAIDGWTERWRARAVQACVEAPALVQDGGCLALAAVELETLVDVLERAPTIDVALRNAVHDLAAPESCTSEPAPRSDAAVAAVVRDRLARASALTLSHRYDGALSLTSEAVALARGDDALSAEALAKQSKIRHEAGDYPGEAESAESAHAMAEAAGLDALAAETATLRVLSAAQVQNDFASAATWARHADAAIDRMPADARELARARLQIGRGHILHGTGRSKEAAQTLAAAIEVLERHDDVAPSELAGAYNDHGTYLLDREPEAALASFEHAAALLREHYGEAYPRAAMLLSNIGAVHYHRGAYEDAAQSFAEAARVLETTLGEHHPDVAGAYMNLAVAQDELGDQLAARASMARAIEIFVVALGTEHPDVALARINVGAFDLEHGDLDAAEAGFRQALAMLETTVGPDHTYCGNALRGLAEVALARGRAERAVPLFERAIEIDAAQARNVVQLAGERLALGRAQAAAGDRRAGEATVRAAIVALEADPAAVDPQGRAEALAELHAWLAAERVTEAVAGSG